MNRNVKSSKLNSAFTNQMYYLLNLILASCIFCSCTMNKKEKKSETSTTQYIHQSTIETVNFLESLNKIYSFNTCKLNTKDYDYSPVKETDRMVSTINIRINSKKIKLYDLNMKLLYSFNIVESKMDESIDISNGTTSNYINLTCNTKVQSDIKINITISGIEVSSLYVEYKIKNKEINLNLWNNHFNPY